jgi:hypothetical protein
VEFNRLGVDLRALGFREDTTPGAPICRWVIDDVKVEWHDCRHSFASQHVIGGTPLRQVQDWLGHSTITMTMRYAHLAPGGGREYLAALDANHGKLTAMQGGGSRISA